MAAHFRCPCGIVLNVAEGSAGKGGQCPSCGKVVIVPGDAAVVVPGQLGRAAPPADTPAAAEPERTGGPVTEVAPPSGPTRTREGATAEGAQASGAAPPIERRVPAEPEWTGAPVEAPFDAPAGAAPPIERRAPGEAAAPIGTQAAAAARTELFPEAPGAGPGPGAPGPVDEPDALRSAAIQALADLDDIAGEPDDLEGIGGARPVAKKGGFLGKLIVVFLILVLLAAGGLAGVVHFAPHLLPDWLRAPLKSYGIIKPARRP